MRYLPIILMLTIAPSAGFAQFYEGDFMISAGGSWKAKNYTLKESLDSQLDIQIGYYPMERLGLGLLGNYGLSQYSYSETKGDGVTYVKYRDGRWGGVGPYVRYHLGDERFSFFGQLSIVFGRVGQDSESNLTEGTPLYYREEGNYSQVGISGGIWWYFTPRFGAEAIVSSEWVTANIRSGNVESDREVAEYGKARITDNGGGGTIRLI